MAEQLLHKSAIIEHYVRNTNFLTHQQNAGDEGLSFRKVKEMMKNSGHHELHEMNRSLQVMLEEALTKNIHLQQVRPFLLFSGIFG